MLLYMSSLIYIKIVFIYVKNYYLMFAHLGLLMRGLYNLCCQEWPYRWSRCWGYDDESFGEVENVIQKLLLRSDEKNMALLCWIRHDQHKVSGEVSLSLACSGGYLSCTSSFVSYLLIRYNTAIALITTAIKFYGDLLCPIKRCHNHSSNGII